MASGGADDDAIFTTVSRPRTVEAHILQTLAPRFCAHRRVAGVVSVRTLESTIEQSGPTIVLLHGRGHAATMWAPVASLLAETHRVAAIDLPGFGHSAAAPLTSDDPRAGLAFFSKPVSAWLKTRSDASIVLVGHSLGGLVALDLALAKELPIAALVLINAMGLHPEVTLKSRLYLRAGPERIARARGLLGMVPDVAARADDLEASLLPLRHELLTTRGGRPQASRAFNTMLPLTGPVFHHRPRLGEIDAPVLLLWGERDDAFLLPVAIDARARFKNAELVTLDAGHSPHVELPTQTYAALEAFLRRSGER